MNDPKRQPWLELSVDVSGAAQEQVIAELQSLGFGSFWQEAGRVRAYVSEPQWTATRRRETMAALQPYAAVVAVREKAVADENWNRLWEASVEPVGAGRFVIAPGWQEIPDALSDRVPIRIDPKMSFGTGHHASTRLVLRLLPGFIRSGAQVLDLGAGTGILAIAAVKLGASSVEACDPHPWSQRNARENFGLNAVGERIIMRDGSLEAVEGHRFDVICANINRSVLADLLPALKKRLAPAGIIIFSGLLAADRTEWLRLMSAAGMTCLAEESEDGWWAVAGNNTHDR